MPIVEGKSRLRFADHTSDTLVALCKPYQLYSQVLQASCKSHSAVQLAVNNLTTMAEIQCSNGN